MKILVLGGTGSIGSGIVRALNLRGHEVFGLARSQHSATTLLNSGVVPVMGDIKHPQNWIDIVDEVDGVVQAAATWDDEMEMVDRNLVESLLDHMANTYPPRAMVYTGGCWLYGTTGDDVASEDSPYDAPDKFSSSVPTIEKVLRSSGVRGMVIHPAMVYEKSGGVFSHIYEDAKRLGRVRVVGGEQVRWPLVHTDDLGTLYALMLESGRAGDVFNAAAIEGFTIGRITRAIAATLGVPNEPAVLDVASAREAYGPWADGYAIDQQMSGRKAMETLGWQPRHLDPVADIS